MKTALRFSDYGTEAPDPESDDQGLSGLTAPTFQILPSLLQTSSLCWTLSPSI